MVTLLALCAPILLAALLSPGPGISGPAPLRAAAAATGHGSHGHGANSGHGAAHGSAAGEASGTTSAAARTHHSGDANNATVEIAITGAGFNPANVTIARGTNVRWTNNTSERARVRDVEGDFLDSDTLEPGESFAFTFNSVGTFSIEEVRQDFLGTITVTDGPVASPTTAGTPAATNTPGGVVEVAIQGFVFQPQNLTIQVGTTVRWVNRDSDRHTATSDTGVFASPELELGQSYQFTFNTPGTYGYFCARHTGMRGSITVVAAGSGPTSTPTPAGTATAQPTGQPQPTQTPAQGVIEVAIQGFVFQPQNLTIQVGTTVRWVNRDSDRHTATSDTGVFASPELELGQSYQFTFNTPGTYGYFCARHTGMRGSITVVAAGSGPTSTPTSRPTTAVTSTAQPTGQPQATATRVPAIVEVKIQGYAFSPRTITVPAGTTVRWTNLDNDGHTVTRTGLFDSGRMNLNDTFSFTFNTPGSYSYDCLLHLGFMTGTVTVELAATPEPSPTMAPGQVFSDVRPADYFFRPVGWLVERGAVSGYADGTFRPFSNTTRGQVAKIVVLAEQMPLSDPARATFSDVPPENPFYRYVETAVARSLVSGYADGTFRWAADVTRGQLVKIVVTARGWPLLDPAAPTFADVDRANPFYRHVETAHSRGAIAGYTVPGGQEFRWTQNAVRGQIATILHRAIVGAGE